MSACASLRALVAAVLFAPALAGLALAAGAQTERELATVFAALDANKLELAMQRVEALIAANPNFRLAHLIRGDLLMARTRPLATFGNAKHLPRERVEELRAEALARINAWRDRPVNRVPRYVLQLESQQKQALVVDSKRSRLYVFENLDGRARYVTDYYVTLGKNGIEKAREGDQKTPIGVYHVISSLPRQKLADFYGSGAWPINYPNEWDRRQGRNGHGIWLHGTPSNTYSRPPRASDGCIVLANADLDLLGQDLQIGLTPVIIADRIEWVDANAQEAERKALAGALEAWRTDWESLDTARYLKHYAAKFESGGQALAEWSEHKHKVNAGKSWIKVGLSQVSMFRYPGEGDFVVVTFMQDYRSSNLSNAMKKRQYWIKDGARWKILHEGAA
jgi:murein L,D-transpeptidase YafK